MRTNCLLIIDFKYLFLPFSETFQDVVLLVLVSIFALTVWRVFSLNQVASVEADSSLERT